jgi:hypothetical protein
LYTLPFLKWFVGESRQTPQDYHFAAAPNRAGRRDETFNRNMRRIAAIRVPKRAASEQSMSTSAFRPDVFARENHSTIATTWPVYVRVERQASLSDE